MIYEVSHRTVYRYSQPVSISHHLLHLTPRDGGFQACRDTAVEITPAPTVRAPGIDYFGNPTTFVTIQQNHVELVLHALSSIEVADRPIPNAAATPAWEAVREQALQRPLAGGAGGARVHLRLALRAPGRRAAGLRRRARSRPGRPILEGARELTHRIFTDFTYEPGATTLGTGVVRAFAMRRGVCQDFAHIQIACLRALGLPARYVSGYLLTRPAEGKERMVGADASHAWLSIWVPGHDWVDLDPTNDLIPGREHITIGWGRDYGDVSPVSGVMFGGGAHEVTVAVDVLAAG